MGFYVRASRHTRVGMPWWVALFIMPVYWSVLACFWMCVWMFKFGVWLTVVTVRLMQHAAEAPQGGG